MKKKKKTVKLYTYDSSSVLLAIGFSIDSGRNTTTRQPRKLEAVNRHIK